ncbi:MAG: hypothetical protein WHX53_06425 [Anaerolineae bacterium]
METELFAIMFILVVLAIIYALVSGTRGRIHRDEEEKLKRFRDLLAAETDDERRRQAAAIANTLTDLIMIAMLMAIIAIAFAGMRAAPA